MSFDQFLLWYAGARMIEALARLGVNIIARLLQSPR